MAGEKKEAPPGTEEVRLKRLEGPIGNTLQVLSALLFASYFWFGPIMGCSVAAVSPVGLNLLGWRSTAAVVGSYFLQLIFYRPQLKRGWPALLLTSRLSDYVLHYYDSTSVREGPPLDPKRQYLFAMYPHGVYGVCRAFTGGVTNWDRLFPGIGMRWGSFGMAFYLPGIREFSLLAGCLDAGKPTLVKAIKRGENIALLPGGLDEMALTDGLSKDTKLVGRRGFVALAIEHGMDIVPGFCFGEKWIHRTVQLPGFISRFLRSRQMSGTMLKGRGLTFLGFLDVPLGYVWAEPIKVEKKDPTTNREYVEEVFNQVEASLKDIFDRYKGRFGYDEKETLSMITVEDAQAAAGHHKKKKNKAA